MHQLSAKLSHLSIALFVLLVSFATDAQSAPPSISSNNRPEAQMSIQEMEKFFEGLTRYLHRQHLDLPKVHQQSQEEQQPGSYEADAIDRSGDTSAPTEAERSSSSSELANHSLSHPRPPMANKWPWSLSHLERIEDDPDFKERQQPYAKRNSELINSLLGLPRFMKVVG
ncbi:uncharacterized protein LOC124209600 [Daphnia pulex]|uniref:uncharacterized protein LOC124209600 n=1 Tax=Daphnia pulex TaxID=6669 RepID=UPI001EDE9C32|nr:uncharacterized protein LOC124209600 [Daphnia pulex]